MSPRIVVAGAAVLWSVVAAAMWMPPPAPVPVSRLIENIAVRVAESPENPRLHYILGRLHSLAFEGRQAVEANDSGFPKPAELQALSSATPEHPDAGARLHLAAALRELGKAHELMPEDELGSVGLAWALEQASRLKPPLEGYPAAASRTRALELYRAVWASAADRRNHLPLSALDAGRRLLALLEPSEEREAVARILKSYEALPQAVTPIVFPLDRPRALETLLAPERRVGFDLAGDGVARRWPWVAKDTALLVWDPLGTGRVANAQQLFGSATWWMFFDDGYAALEALDDDRDGFLAGNELDGLAAWVDADGSGTSDPGEVRPLAACGVRRLAVRATTTSGGVPANGRGVERADGTWLPTYDWRPVSDPGELSASAPATPAAHRP